MHRYERAYGLFERTSALPTSVDAGQIQARYENGLLPVTLPKVERAKPRVILQPLPTDPLPTCPLPSVPPDRILVQVDKDLLGLEVFLDAPVAQLPAEA